MKALRHDRSLIAWTLYACVLFNLFACTIAHGQMAGLQLSGLDGLFCSAEGVVQADVAQDSSTPVASAPFSCPLCAAVTLDIALFFALAWLLRLGGEPRLERREHSKTPPRYLWPSANPRASPSFLAIK